MRRLLLIPLLLSAPALHGDGLEASAGIVIGPTAQGPAGGDSTTALQVRVGWDRAPSHVRMDHWDLLAQSGSNQNLKYQAAGFGWRHSWWSDYHGAQGALAAEMRVERYQGHDSLYGGPSPLASDRAWMARPWLRAQAGFRGILFPLPSPAAEALHWLTQGGTYSHPFTRLELAFPLWHQGGDGPSGTLRRMAPRWEASVQLGMRFGRPPRS